MSAPTQSQDGKATGRDTDVMAGFAKGLGVIECFDASRPKLSIADVARLTGLERAVARRCLITLTRLGYAAFDGKFFTLTPRLLRLGYAYLASTPLPTVVQPFLTRLSEETGESCSASVLDGTEIIYVARAAQRRVLSINLGIGSRLPAYCASMGRVLLAALPDDRMTAILEASDRRKLTRHTKVEPADLRREINAVRTKGFALVDEELELGLRSIAVPIKDWRGTVVAAMNIGVHAARVSAAQLMRDFLPKLLAAQQEIARLLT